MCFVGTYLISSVVYFFSSWPLFWGRWLAISFVEVVFMVFFAVKGNNLCY